MRRTGPSYTLETIRRLRRRYPRRRFFFLIGADTVPELRSWHRYRALLAQVEFAAVARPGYRLRVPREMKGRLRIIPGRGVDVSSTRLRAALIRGRRPRGLPAPVAAYIRRRKLYAGQGPERGSGGARRRPGGRRNASRRLAQRRSGRRKSPRRR